MMMEVCNDLDWIYTALARSVGSTHKLEITFSVERMLVNILELTLYLQ